MVLEDATRHAARLAHGFRGRLIEPDAADYDRARRVHNAAVDRHPALIARPSDADDVALLVGYAQEWGLPLVVRAGGHGMAGHGTGDGALVLDLSAMRGVEIDAVGRTAWADAAPGTALEEDGPRRISLAVGDADPAELSGPGPFGLELTTFALRSDARTGTDQAHAQKVDAGGN